MADLDLREFALDGSSYRVRKLFIQHEFLVNLFRDIFPAARCVLLICFLSTTNAPQLAAGIFYSFMWSSAASTAQIIEASSPVIFCFSPSNHRLAAPSVVPVSSGSPPLALTRA